jgi:uncharacterized membrane protein
VSSIILTIKKKAMVRKPSYKLPSARRVPSKKETDHPAKSVLKAVSWRIVGTLDTIFISYLITGRFIVAVSIGSVEVFTKILLYYLHERAWEHMPRRIPLSRIIRYRFHILKRRYIARPA